MKLKLTIFVTLMLIEFCSQAQIITTIAGNGASGYNGDSISSTSAELQNPEGVAIDHSGNIYIADFYNSRVRKVNRTTGIITTIAGTGTFGYNGDNIQATSAQIEQAYGIALDNVGNIYFSDMSNNRIRKITISTGIITTVAGNGFAGFNGDNILATSARLNQPEGIALDDSGNIYIADMNNGRIRKVTTSSGIITSILTSIPDPTSLALDASGNIYFGCLCNNIQKYTISTSTLSNIAGISSFGYNGDNILATSAELYNPIGVALDISGNIYIADELNQRIRKVSASTGIITTIAGNGNSGYNGDNIIATSAKLFQPWAIAVDDSNNIYIADMGNSRIRRVTQSCSLSINNQPINQNISVGNNGFFFVTTNDSTALYQWQENYGIGFVNLFNAGPYSGVTTDTLNISGVTQSMNNYLFRCIVTSNSCIDTTITATLTVNLNTGIKTNLFNDIQVSIFPNPVQSLLNFHLSNYLSNLIIIISDVFGREVLKESFSSIDKNIDISNWEEGVYFYQIKGIVERKYGKFFVIK